MASVLHEFQKVFECAVTPNPAYARLRLCAINLLSYLAKMRIPSVARNSTCRAFRC